MPISIEDQITELLCRNAGQNLTLQQVHQLLVREIGYAAGSYHELQKRLKDTQHRFVLLDHADPLAQGAGWSHEVREAYVSALDRAGIDLSPIISLVPTAADEDRGDIVHALRTTLLRLSGRVSQDPAAREDLVVALASIRQLPGAAQTTTHLHDPPGGP